jgi:hypothetical protein
MSKIQVQLIDDIDYEMSKINVASRNDFATGNVLVISGEIEKKWPLKPNKMRSRYSAPGNAIQLIFLLLITLTIQFQYEKIQASNLVVNSHTSLCRM